jgi:hypothetical protein
MSAIERRNLDGGAVVRAFMLIVAGVAVIVIVGRRVLRSDYRYRYRLTVEVETPDGLRTGSAVEEQIAGKSHIDLGDLSAKRWIRTRGEAAAVDLPRGQTLFAVIPKSEVAQAVLDPKWQNDWVESARRIASGDTPKGPVSIDPARYPTLVRFRDINDPKTVEKVDPTNLAATFGADVRLRRVTLQLTRDPVSADIARRLKWLDSYVNRSFDGQRFSNPYGPVVETLRAGDFRRR